MIFVNLRQTTPSWASLIAYQIHDGMESFKHKNKKKRSRWEVLFIETHYEAFFTARKMRLVKVASVPAIGRCNFAALLALFPHSAYQRRSVAWSAGGSCSAVASAADSVLSYQDDWKQLRHMPRPLCAKCGEAHGKPRDPAQQKSRFFSFAAGFCTAACCSALNCW